MNLPPLREELVVTTGPRAHDGQPGWTLQDPARNRFFRLDWLTFEILQRWSLGEPEVIARVIGEQTPLKPGASDVESVVTFLGVNQLLKFAGADNSAALSQHHAASRQGTWRWLLHNYLFFRVPLVRPERLLRWLVRRLAFLFSPLFWQVTGAAALVGLLLVARQWDGFKAAWNDYSNLPGLLLFAFVIAGVKVAHELGHGLAATYFGCRVPTMGIAFLVLTPVAYTDTNESWNLRERRPRLLIGAAGMLAELGLAAWAALAWGVLPDGFWRSTAFLVATTTWVKSLLINASPVMRFDGYYLLSDFLDIPNLHSRVFALARWKLREWLFRLQEPPPEHFRRSLARGLIALAIFIWVYRLVVFLGIAVFVYYFFFKALGIVLFVVEIAWFVVLPIVAEIKEWGARRERILGSRRLRFVAAGGLAFVLLGIVPLPQRVRLMGELRPQREFRVVAPESARLVRLGFTDGATVEPGQTLLRLESPELQHRRDRAQARVTMLEGMIAAAGVDPAMRARLPMLQAMLSTAEAVGREAEVALAQLAPVAPFRGVWRLADCELRPGDWIGRQEDIATLIGENTWQVVGYVGEQSAHLLKAGARARFYPDGCPEAVIELNVRSIEKDAARSLSHPMLTTPFGGDVPARIVENDVVPVHGVYRITFEVISARPGPAAQVRRGAVVISAGSESVLAQLSRSFVSLVWREAGF